MDFHTSCRALHVLPISLVEDSLSSKLLWLASANVFAPSLRLLGCVLSKNRRVWLVVPWIASFFASISLLVVAYLMHTDDIEKYQKAFLLLLCGNYGLLVVCEVGLLLDLDFLGLGNWFIFGMYIVETLIVAGLYASIVEGADLFWVLRLLLLSTSAEYLLVSIGLAYLFLGPVRGALGVALPGKPFWYRGWPLLSHALLQLSISVLALTFAIENWAKINDLLFFSCVFLTVSNICTLRILLRQSLQLLFARFSPHVAAIWTRLSTKLAMLHHFSYRYVARRRPSLMFYSMMGHCRGFRTTPSEDQYCMENCLEAGEQQSKECSAASSWLPFPQAVFRLHQYTLVCVSLPKVEPHQHILCTITQPDGTSVVIVLKSYVSALEGQLGTICRPYDFKLGSVDVQSQTINALSSLLVDNISKDSIVEKGLWVFADPCYIVKLFTIWLKDMTTQSKESSQPAGIKVDIDNDIGRITSDGEFNFEDYTLVRLSFIGSHRCIEILEMLDMISGTLDDVLSAEELPDETWELPVLKTHLPTLKAKLSKTFPGCNIESDYDPTQPNHQEVEMFGYDRAKALRTITACDRADRMRSQAWPKAAFYYAHLSKALRYN